MLKSIVNNKNKIIFSLVFLFLLNFLFTGVFNVSYADDGDEDKPNILIRVLTWAFRFVNKYIYNKLDDEGLSIDSLIFKKVPDEGEGEFIGLTLFKPGDAQDFIATFYNIFLYIAMAMFVPIFYWIGVHFSKAGDNPQEKSILKDKLMRIVMTFIFLYSMPELLVALVKVSNAFTNMFGGIGAEFLGAEGTTGIVAQYIENNTGSIIETITGLMLIGINLWIIVFYIIRDLTIAFLFMLFPIIAIWYPMRKGMVTNWWREMAGNILAQPIQAMILTMVLALGQALGMGGSKSLGAGIYTLVAFGFIIPMTSIVKGFLGLETGLGAGRSMAGLGALFGALGLVRMARRGMSEQTQKIKDGVSTLADNRVKKKELEKNIEPSASDVTRTLSNSNASVVDNILSSTQSKDSVVDSIGYQNRVAGRQIARGVGGAILGTFTGITGATIGAGLGVRGSAIMGATGFSLGRRVGDAGTGMAYMGADAIYQHRQMRRDIADIQESIMSDDISNVRMMQINELKESEDFQSLSPDQQLEMIEGLKNNMNITKSEIKNMKKEFPNTYNTYKERAQNEYLGIAHPKMDGTEFQSQEREALMTQKRWQATGTGRFANYMANMGYAKLTPVRKTPEELRSIDNAYLYQDNERTVVYTQDSDGSIGDVLHVGSGNPYISTPIEQPVAYTSEEIEIPPSEMYKINERVRIDTNAYMDSVYSHLDKNSSEYRQAYIQREKYNKDFYISHYKNRVEQIRGNIGVSNLNFRNDEIYLAKEKAKIDKMLDIERERQEVKSKTYMEDTGYSGAVKPNLDNLQ